MLVYALRPGDRGLEGLSGPFGTESGLEAAFWAVTLVSALSEVSRETSEIQQLCLNPGESAVRGPEASRKVANDARFPSRR